MQRYNIRYYNYVFESDLDANKINPVTMMKLCEHLDVDMKNASFEPFHDGAITMNVEGSGSYVLEPVAADTPLTEA